jgi:hypothetical protein
MKRRRWKHLRFHSLPFTRKLRSMLQAGLLAYPVPAAFPSHLEFNSGRVCRNLCRIYSCGYSSCFSQDSLFARVSQMLTREPVIAKQIYPFFCNDQFRKFSCSLPGSYPELPRPGRMDQSVTKSGSDPKVYLYTE